MEGSIMKKIYFEPDAEWIYYRDEDVITTSQAEESSVEADPEEDWKW